MRSISQIIESRFSHSFRRLDATFYPSLIPMIPLTSLDIWLPDNIIHLPPQIVLESVVSLAITVSLQSSAQLISTAWTFPRLQHLGLVDFHGSSGIFPSWTTFVRRHAHTITSLSFSNWGHCTSASSGLEDVIGAATRVRGLIIRDADLCQLPHTFTHLSVTHLGVIETHLRDDSEARSGPVWALSRGIFPKLKGLKLFLPANVCHRYAELVRLCKNSSVRLEVGDT